MPDMLVEIKWQPTGEFLQRLPILGTIRDCEATGYGWRGHMSDGTMLEVRPRDPGTRAEIQI
jgi:hypothetical protein